MSELLREVLGKQAGLVRALFFDKPPERSWSLPWHKLLVMRPLVAHSSRTSAPGTNRHRRILHFEFSGDPILPAGFQWQTFLPVGPA